MPDVVTFAPKLDAPLTAIDVALVIAAFKSNAPVIVIAPTAADPPTTPSKLISVELPPVSIVKFLVEPSLLTVLSKVTTSLLVVKVTLALKVTASPYV